MTKALALRYSDGFWPTAAALGYIAAAYVSGFVLLIWGGLIGWLPGVILLGHAMIIAAYMTHECAHNAVFVSPKHNEWLGNVLGWFTGACYANYSDVREKHMRHHVDRADVIFLDFRPILQDHPMLRRVLMGLEWFYVPATCLWIHALVLVLPFATKAYRSERWRVIVFALVRWPLFIALAWFAWPAALGYIVAYSLCIIVLRIMDMHQHTYELLITLKTDKKGPPEGFDRAYEHRNTFSNPIGSGVLANWLVLNFGFHNAHHERPTEPWYRLRKLDHSLFGRDESQRLPFSNILRNYAQHRVARVTVVESGDLQEFGASRRVPSFMGVYGVSFLTPL